jgi:predicted TIM-barrel fold metal-dependent hydrolase
MRNPPTTRRQFLAVAASASAASALPAEKSSRETIVDIHQHGHYLARPDDALIAHQRQMGITKTVLLPAALPVNRDSTHQGKSNGLAARVTGTAAAAKLAATYPKEFVFFCNEVPDLDNAKTVLEGWLKKGAIGIGEQKFGVAADSEPIHLVASIAQEFDVPVLLHFQFGMYNVGFDRFHKILEKYPKVNFIGHAQTWWGHVDKNHDPKVLYPDGKVTPGGLTDRYLSDYPNMFGDLSAGSGQNSLKRDEAHAAEFLTRHQDKLMFGSDCPDREGQGGKCIGAGTLDIIRRLVPDASTREKIFYRNARKVIRLD